MPCASSPSAGRDARCRALLLVDAILPERAKDSGVRDPHGPAHALLLGARERTEAEFRALLGEAGFEVARVVPTRLAGRV